MKRHSSEAFTLVELMVVIAVIFLLVAMMMPSFSQVIHVAHQTQCTSNLEHMGQAFSLVTANVRITSGAPLAPNGWYGQIQPYTGKDLTLPICPEGSFAGIGSSGDLDQLLAGYALRTYSGGTFLYDMPLCEGPCCLKINIRNNGMGYDLSFEDQRTSDGQQQASYSDHSYANPIMGVDFDGSAVTISVKGGSGGYSWDLVDPSKKVLMVSVTKTTPVGASCKLSGDYGGTMSYGMNSQAPLIKPSDDRIMALDYPTEIARLADVDTTRDNWMNWTDDQGQFTFARHFGRCNVLMANGRVIPLTPQQIDPTNPTLLSQYWKP